MHGECGSCVKHNSHGAIGVNNIHLRWTLAQQQHLQQQRTRVGFEPRDRQNNTNSKMSELGLEIKRAQRSPLGGRRLRSDTLGSLV
eukprot:85747-Amphidinium_carterae.1